MDNAAYSAEGLPLSDGESGELVCRKPFPNMPVMFWRDPGKKRYHGTYFEAIPGFSTVSKPNIGAFQLSRDRCLDTR